MSIKFFVAMGSVTRTTGRTRNVITVHPMLLLKETKEEAQRALQHRLTTAYPDLKAGNTKNV